MTAEKQIQSDKDKATGEDWQSGKYNQIERERK
jgi:hypothetical protein